MATEKATDASLLPAQYGSEAVVRLTHAQRGAQEVHFQSTRASSAELVRPCRHEPEEINR